MRDKASNFILKGNSVFGQLWKNQDHFCIQNNQTWGECSQGSLIKKLVGHACYRVWTLYFQKCGSSKGFSTPLSILLRYNWQKLYICKVYFDIHICCEMITVELIKTPITLHSCYFFIFLLCHVVTYLVLSPHYLLSPEQNVSHFQGWYQPLHQVAEYFFKTSQLKFHHIL